MYETPVFSLLLPEMIILSMACVILVVDLFLSERTRVFSYALSQLTLLLAFIATWQMDSQTAQTTFNGTFVHDGMADLLKLAMYVITAGVFLYSRDYLRDRGLFKGEYYVLGLFGLLGMMVMVSSGNMLALYLGLELLSLCLYAMVAFDRDSPACAEAAMKYFVLGAIASGMLLYGMSMLYGATGTLDLADLAQALSERAGNDLVLTFGLVFVVVGIGFKLGAVPFHMWLPDVYQGAMTSVTLYIGSIPKLAAFAMIMRLLGEGLGDLHADWQDMLIVLAVLSMAVGNIIAIAQTNIKRMLAYSTISHMGFLLLGILSGTSEGYSAAMFYAVVYSLMALGGFGILLLLSRKGFEAENLEDFKGLNERSPWFAFIMLVVMFSMAGVPPTAGFYAKLAVLAAVVNVDLVWLAIVAVMFSVIGVFYYLRVIKLMYFDKPEDDTPLAATIDMRIAISVNGLAILGLGLFPAGLMSACLTAIG